MATSARQPKAPLPRPPALAGHKPTGALPSPCRHVPVRPACVLTRSASQTFCCRLPASVVAQVQRTRPEQLLRCTCSHSSPRLRHLLLPPFLAVPCRAACFGFPVATRQVIAQHTTRTTNAIMRGGRVKPSAPQRRLPSLSGPCHIYRVIQVRKSWMGLLKLREGIACWGGGRALVTGALRVADPALRRQPRCPTLGCVAARPYVFRAPLTLPGLPSYCSRGAQAPSSDPLVQCLCAACRSILSSSETVHCAYHQWRSACMSRSAARTQVGGRTVGAQEEAPGRSARPSHIMSTPSDRRVPPAGAPLRLVFKGSTVKQLLNSGACLPRTAPPRQRETLWGRGRAAQHVCRPRGEPRRQAAGGCARAAAVPGRHPPSTPLPPSTAASPFSCAGRKQQSTAWQAGGPGGQQQEAAASPSPGAPPFRPPASHFAWPGCHLVGWWRSAVAVRNFRSRRCMGMSGIRLRAAARVAMPGVHAWAACPGCTVLFVVRMCCMNCCCTSVMQAALRAPWLIPPPLPCPPRLQAPPCPTPLGFPSALALPSHRLECQLTALQGFAACTAARPASSHTPTIARPRRRRRGRRCSRSQEEEQGMAQRRADPMAAPQRRLRAPAACMASHPASSPTQTTLTLEAAQAAGGRARLQRRRRRRAAAATPLRLSMRGHAACWAARLASSRSRWR